MIVIKPLSVRRVRMSRARVKRVTRVCLNHSQRDLVAQEVGVMHQVSYFSSVSTLCQNEIKDRNKSVQQHIFISFSFSGKKWCPPPPPPPMLEEHHYRAHSSNTINMPCGVQ